MAWLPLESNPEVMTKYLHKVGVPKNIEVTDVFGLDPELLAMVPRPVIAVILLFPCSENYEKFKSEEEEKLKGQEQKLPDSLFYMKQCVHNACGTVALIHSVANNLDTIQLDDGILKDYLDKAELLTAQERGELLDKLSSMIETHKDLAVEGQTEAPAADEKINHHFVAFIHKDGTLFEMDGRKFGPITHGATSPHTLLEDAAKVCKTFIARDPDEVRFTVVAVTAAS